MPSPDDVPDDAIYLDNAATTRMLPSTAEVMARVQVDNFGNPSSSHGFAARPKRLLDDAREFLRGTFCAGRAVLTSGGSEADQLAVVGAALAREPGKVLCGAADHPAILMLRSVLRRLGHQLVEVPVNAHGVITPAALEPHLDESVRVVALLHGHNELGSLVDLDALVPLIRTRARDAHIHLDLVQAYGKLAFDLDRATGDGQGVDSAAISAHKFHGPRGVGCLALANTAKITPLMPAGGQESGLRGGTENVAGAVAMAHAAEVVWTELAALREKADTCANLLLTALRSVVPKTRRLGDPDRRLPQILSVQVPGLRAQTLQELLAARHIAFSTGSACHSDDDDSDNHVLRAIGLERRQAREVARFSFGRDTTVEQVTAAAEQIVAAVRELHRLAPTAPPTQSAQDENA